MRSRGFVLETPSIDLEIFRLVSLVAASPKLAGLQDDNVDGNKWEYLRMLEFCELSRILISVSAIVRSGLDAEPLRGGHYSIALERPVGVLVPNMGDPDKALPLKLREACNKILHAKEVEPRWERIREHGPRYLTKDVCLRGHFRGSDWSATLDVYQFALAATVMV